MNLPQTPRPSVARRPARLALLALALAGCGQGESLVREIPASRARPGDELGIVWDATSAERFGFEQTAPAAPAGGELVWTTPPGWRELPGSSMRVANFQVAGDERAECYLTLLGGDGGGLLANVNRWRKQMSLREITERDLADAPRAPLLGSEAVQVDLEGTWTGMGGDQSGEGYRLVGLLSVEAGEARFLKMVGPADVVGGQIEAFLDLAASFERGGPASSPHGAGPPMVATGGSGASLDWTAPPGWREAPARAMREVTFEVGDESDPAECYVVVLGGNGGGALPNINRWCSQMEQPDLTQREFDALATVPMLGTQALVVEIAGTYRGMGDDLVEQGYLLGAVCELGDRAVFVKMVGPEATVRGAREDFLSFCRSLE